MEAPPPASNVENAVTQQQQQQQDAECQEDQLPPVNRGIIICFFLFLLSTTFVFGFLPFFCAVLVSEEEKATSCHGKGFDNALMVFFFVLPGVVASFVAATIGALYTKQSWIHLTTVDKIMGLFPGVGFGVSVVALVFLLRNATIVM